MKTHSDAEAARLAVTREYPLGERGSDAALSEACRLATLLCHRPMAAVEMVLADSMVVAAAAGLHVGRIRREDALSSHLLNEQGVVVIPDCCADPRFQQSRLVTTSHGIRFYAAVPLCAPEGAVLGVLSVWDHVPGDLTPSQAESLEALGRMVMAQLNLWRRQRQLERLEAQHACVEATLRETESKFRGIFENTVVGIYQTTPEGRYLSANPMLARIYGYETPEELVAAVGDIQHQLYVDPAARDRFIAALQQQNTITNFEAQIRRKDGSVIWISEDARVVRDSTGTVKLYEGTVQDITARRMAEERLRTSEMLYHSLVEELPQNVFRKDNRERFIFANSRFCKTVERSLDQILGRTDFDLFPSELARKYQTDDQRVMAEGRTLRQTERYVTPDGTVHWVEVIKTPLLDAGGTVKGIQGIFWDVTERQSLQDALAYERDLLQALLDHSPDIIYFKDPQSRFVKVGRALARRFHVADPEDLVGKSSLDLLTPDLAHAVHAEEQELLRTGQPRINQVEELVDHQGRRSWASVTKVPIYNRAGATLGLVVVARDITQLVEAEQAMREAEEKYRAIFENSVEGIFQTSPEGRFIRVNPALARIYGYASPEELISHLTDIRTQVYVDPGRREEFVRLALEEGAITGFESQIYRKDRTKVWVSESARIVRDRDGRLVYFEGTVEDISVRKQIEAEREATKHAALESARMKSEFVATVSHEIRTPLNAIVPNAERLLEADLSPQQRYLVESVDHGAKMLLQIVNDILDFSTIEVGAVRFDHIDFDLHELVERTVSFFAGRAHARKIDLVGIIRPDVPRRVRGDPSRLGQILNNLIGNAIKFTETGEVVIAVEQGEATPDSLELRFDVRDTGIGIPEEAHDRVFQAFAQADGSMSRRYGGTGLGLVIARGLVELMGGRIDFTSEVGRGTTFHFNVQMARSANPGTGTPRDTLLADYRVLVVDDNATQREWIADALRSLGAAGVATADRIGAAVAQLNEATRERQPFDLILFDAELPEGSLLQLAFRLRAGGGAKARLIALTSAGNVADIRGLEAAGIAGILVKPLRQTRLHTEIDAILRGQSQQLAKADAVPTHPGKDLCVLVVEDQPLNQRVVRELLERLGAQVDTVSSGGEAVQKAASSRYDLIFMDCQMPGMDGYEATRRIRADEKSRNDPTTRPVPIVALSANALADDRDRGIAAGMDDYLTKPLSQTDLVRVLMNVARPAKDDSTSTATTPPMANPTPITPVTPSATPQPASVSTSAPSPAPAPSTVPAPDSGPAEVPIIDPTPLQALTSPDTPGVLTEFITSFIAEAPPRLIRLKAAASARDAAALRAEAHSFKGSASYMGARRLVAACAQLEKDARESALDNAMDLVARVETEFEQARVALEGYVTRPTPPA